MKKFLDLRFNGKLESEVSLLFNKVAFEQRKYFNEFVSEISSNNINSLDWWVQGPASRNTYSSSLFHSFCVIHLLSKMIQDKIFLFDEVLVDSLSLARIIEDLFLEFNITKCKVKIQNSLNIRLKFVLKKYFLIFFLLLKKYFQIIVANAVSSNINYTKPLVLIDTFLMPGYVDDDRWYGVFWENLTAKQKAETFFIPTLVQTKFKNIISIYQEAALSNCNYIFKEKFLKFDDIIFAYRHNKRIKKIKFKDIKVLNYNFSNLVEYELNNNSDMNSVIESILTYRFVDRFKQEGFEVRLAIDWFEGQCLDKAWNMGFKKYFPGTKTIGYRPTESFPFYLSSYPTLMENDANVLPDVIAVQGRGTEISVKEFFPNLETILIPSFKSSYLWKFARNEPNLNKKLVLLTLPISEKYSQSIINRVIKAANLVSMKKGSFEVVIKPHPAQSLSKLMVGLDELPQHISFTEERSFFKLLSSSSLLITEASSTCLEAMAFEVPVIMMNNQNGLTYDSIPNRISNKMYRKVNSQMQLTQAIEKFVSLTFANKQQLKLESKKVRDEYFEPITQDGINRFMDVNN